MALNASASSRSSRGAPLDVQASARDERVDLVHEPRQPHERRERAADEHEVRAERHADADEQGDSLARVERRAHGRRAEGEGERRDEHDERIQQHDTPRERRGPQGRVRCGPGRARRAGAAVTGQGCDTRAAGTAHGPRSAP